MGLRIRDKAADISHKSIVLGVSVHGNYVVKTLTLNASKTQERYMPAYVPALAVAEERFRGGRRRRIILSVVLPVEQISDRPMLTIIVECPLVIAKEQGLVCTEITARYHR